jgi:anaerobic ribonucleoside-triphosphate reductase
MTNTAHTHGNIEIHSLTTTATHQTQTWSSKPFLQYNPAPSAAHQMVFHYSPAPNTHATSYPTQYSMPGHCSDQQAHMI